MSTTDTLAMPPGSALSATYKQRRRPHPVDRRTRAGKRIGALVEEEKRRLGGRLRAVELARVQHWAISQATAEAALERRAEGDVSVTYDDCVRLARTARLLRRDLDALARNNKPRKPDAGQPLPSLAELLARRGTPPA